MRGSPVSSWALLGILGIVIGMIVFFTILSGNTPTAPQPKEVHFLDQNGEWYAVSVTPISGIFANCYDIIGVPSPGWANCSLKQSASGVYCGVLTILPQTPNDICTQ